MRKEIKKAPTIRFQGFTDEWEQRKLGELITEYKEVVTSNCTLPILTSSKSEGVILQEKHFGHKQNHDITGYNILPRWYCTYRNRSDGVDFTFNINRYCDKGIISKFYPVFCGNKNDTFFISLVLNNSKGVIREIGYTCTGTGQKVLAFSDLQKMKIPTTSFDEQAKIGQYFLSLDQLITLHQRKLDHLKTLKKYFLQNMFPTKGEKVPKIRFKGFTDDWKQRKFGEIAEYKKGPFGSALKKEFFIPDSDISIKVYEQQNAINKDWTLSRYYISQEYAQKLKAFEVHSGDIIVSCAGTIGEIYELPAQSRPGIINQALMRIRVNKDIVCKDIFKLAFSNMIDSLSREFSNGSAIKNIPPFADLKPMKVLLPDKTEQKLIGDFFTDIDKTITLHQRKLNQFQTMKKFMLQNLFI